MSGYISSIITVTTVGGILVSLLSEKSSKLKKQLSFTVGLICALVFISPIVGVLNNSQMIKDSISNIVLSIENEHNIASNEIIVGTSLDRISQGVKSMIINKFELKEQDVEVRVFITDDSRDVIYIDYVEISLKNGAAWIDEKKIEDYVEEMSGCKAKILRL